MLKAYSFEGKGEGEILLVRGSKFRAVERQCSSTVRSLEHGAGFIFPAPSKLVLRSLSGGGSVQFRLAGYLREPTEIETTEIA